MKYATEEAFVGANAFGKGAANDAAFLTKVLLQCLPLHRLSSQPKRHGLHCESRQTITKKQEHPCTAARRVGVFLHLYAVIGWWRGCRRWEPW